MTSSLPTAAGGHRLRIGRYSEPGRAYLVTTVVRSRQRRFLDMGDALATVRCLRTMDAQGLSRTLCYVLMPDHLHWLMVLGEGVSLSEVMRRFKSYSGRRLGGPVWQRGFHDRALRREADLLPAARYVVANPLRAGLVRRLGDYPYWDAVWLEGGG
ncbi:transposase [Alcanivorax marinus]|uniref:Transposase n=1 Tax=Alloalcanivorax marinus TaxID=1177169 RepID=A0A9Q3YSC4_9GAMM|nr:transposase [Alloalcanivorax marinus]MCC4309483.1 transposase [Alloalcanivorax marinus]